MFIDKLEKKYREYFLALCLQAAECDGEINDYEREKIKSYIAELQVKKDIDDLERIQYQTVIRKMRELEFYQKKIVLAELLGVLISDDIYGELEQDFYYQFADSIRVGRKKAEDIELAVFNYWDEYKKFLKVVLS